MDNLWLRAQTDLESGQQTLDYELDNKQIQDLIEYAKTLVKWSKIYNLTSIDTPADIISRHILDSLSILPWLDHTPLMDVGSGAGLPGLIIAIARPEQPCLLVDSSGKRVRFLNHIKRLLNLSNVQIECQRVEDSIKLAEQLKVQQITSRAFAPLDRQINWLQPLLNVRVKLLAMCGQIPHEHLKKLPDNLHCSATIALNVPQLNAERHLVVIEKNK